MTAGEIKKVNKKHDQHVQVMLETLSAGMKHCGKMINGT